MSAVWILCIHDGNKCRASLGCGHRLIASVPFVAPVAIGAYQLLGDLMAMAGRGPR